jgi:hypothetical protein
LPNDFQPTSILPFTVIKCLAAFGGGESEHKRLVAICHHGEALFTVKATSQVECYINSNRLSEVVFYKGGTNRCFEKNTIIQPDNQYAIPHADLIKHHRNGDLTILGTLPANFRDELAKAAESSVTITSRGRKRLLGALGLAS